MLVDISIRRLAKNTASNNHMYFGLNSQRGFTLGYVYPRTYLNSLRIRKYMSDRVQALVSLDDFKRANQYEKITVKGEVFYV